MNLNRAACARLGDSCCFVLQCARRALDGGDVTDGSWSPKVEQPAVSSQHGIVAGLAGRQRQQVRASVATHQRLGVQLGCQHRGRARRLPGKRFNLPPAPAPGCLSAMRHGPSMCLQEVLEAVKFSFEDGPSLNFAEGDSLPLASPSAGLCRATLPQSDWVTVVRTQPRWSSRAPPACTARRWSTCTSSSTRPSSASRRKGGQTSETCPLHNSPLIRNTQRKAVSRKVATWGTDTDAMLHLAGSGSRRQRRRRRLTLMTSLMTRRRS